MKALTLTQPWATLIAIEAKRIETRSWPTKFRGRIAVHAAIKFPREAAALCFQEPFKSALEAAGSPMKQFGIPNLLPVGAIIAICTLVDCIKVDKLPPSYGARVVKVDNRTDYYMVEYPDIPPGEPERSFGDYSPGRYAWLLTDVYRLAEPIPARGALGLWEWEPPANFSPNQGE
jgi:hypothetical protein